MAGDGGGGVAAAAGGAEQTIRRLAPEVVNRVAAGEVIQRPASALKELVENALDAGATAVTATCREGGGRLLQLADNGCGVRRADLALLCERHATSKLRAFEDLGAMSTFGFRGEALASMSYVAHVTVTTMPRGAAHALRAQYRDGRLEGEPAACAGVPGTTVAVEDLFFNVAARKKALRGAAEEYAACLQVVQRYSLLRTDVAFTCRKDGQQRADVHAGVARDAKERVKQVYGAAVARELIELELSSGGWPHGDGDGAGDGGEADPGGAARFSVRALVSSANYAAKKTTFVLFINKRLVDCPPLKRAVEAVYADILPKADKPFVFLDLRVPLDEVDVNVHPTKQEVNFLNQEEVVDAVQRAVQERLLESNNSRTFASQQAAMTQSLLPGAAAPEEAPDARAGTTQRERAGGDHKLVRVDERNPAGRLEAFYRPAAPPPAGADATAGPSGRGASDQVLEPSAGVVAGGAGPKRVRDEDVGGEGLRALRQAAKRQRKWQPCELTSVQELNAESDAAAHAHLTEAVRHHTYVGMADESTALIQHRTKLYTAHVPRLTRDLFYQQVLRGFGQFRPARLAQPAPVRELLMLALDAEEDAGRWSPADGSKVEIAEALATLLQEKGPMLKEYFSLEFDDDGRLLTLPTLVEQYAPATDHMPEFLYRMANDVDWETEKPCFTGVAHALSEFYAVRPLRALDTPAGERGAEEGTSEWTLQHVLFPSMRLFLKVPAERASDGAVMEVACLQRLYRTFERC